MKRKRDEEDSTENAEQADLFSPQGPTVIGPTPQRDGIVLGLFDELPFAYDTPSKPRNILGDVGLNVPQTPSRRLQDAASETSLESRARGERTPLSAGKRFLLNQFVTPKKRRLDEQGTPSSTLQGLATPAFLRRDNVLGAIDEENEPTPRPAPWKRRGLVRSLSTMIQAMKKDEDDKLDEEADIMREMEMEEQGISIPPRKKPKAPQLLVEDSQAPMPLGPDRGFESEDNSDEEPELGRDGKPRKAWKKKGLKRQTRRVISKFITSLLRLIRLTLLQCVQLSRNPSLRQLQRHRMRQKKRTRAYPKHKYPQMRQTSLARTLTTSRTTQAMLPTRPGREE